MPKSDEIFGGAEPRRSADEVFGLPPGASEDTGRGELSKPMFFEDMFAKGGGGEPTAEEMEKAAEAVKFGKYAKLKDYHVHTFDLSEPDQARAYRDQILLIYLRLAEKRCVVSHMEKKLVTEKPARMVVHIEWYEYELGIKDYMKEYEKKSGKPGSRPRGGKAASAPHEGEA